LKLWCHAAFLLNIMVTHTYTHTYIYTHKLTCAELMHA
jgi:hypothetical protein